MILVVNAGSSTLKLRVLDDDDRVVESADLGADDVDGISALVDRVGGIDLVGHRVVHGGHRFRNRP